MMDDHSDPLVTRTPNKRFLLARGWRKAGRSWVDPQGYGPRWTPAAIQLQLAREGLLPPIDGPGYYRAIGFVADATWQQIEREKREAQGL